MVVTFLPFKDFEASVKSLDNKRLGKQRVEAKQIINLLEYLDNCIYVKEDTKSQERPLHIDEKYRQIIFYNEDTPFNTKAQYTKNVTDIIPDLSSRKIAWINHPAVRMWYRYTNALKEYYNHCLQEWLNRDFNNTMEFYDLNDKVIKYPWWLGWDTIHFSHRASLNRKDPKYYKFEVPEEYTRYTYVWPISKKMKKDMKRNAKLEELTKLIE